MNSQIIYKKEIPGQWTNFTMKDLVDIPGIELNDEIDVRRYPPSQGGGEYIDSITIITVTRAIKHEEIKARKIYAGTSEFEILMNTEGWVNQKEESISCEKLKDRKGIKFLTKRGKVYSIYFTSGYWMTLNI